MYYVVFLSRYFYCLPLSSCDLGRRKGSVTVVVSAVSTGAEDGLRFGCNPGLRTKDGVEGGSASFVASSNLNYINILETITVKTWKFLYY